MGSPAHVWAGSIEFGDQIDFTAGQLHPPLDNAGFYTPGCQEDGLSVAGFQWAAMASGLKGRPLVRPRGRVRKRFSPVVWQGRGAGRVDVAPFQRCRHLVQRFMKLLFHQLGNQCFAERRIGSGG